MWEEIHLKHKVEKPCKGEAFQREYMFTLWVKICHLASLYNHVKEVNEKVKADPIACIKAAHQGLDQIWQWYIIKW